jgi:flagellar biosynthesis/type III secretory pathway chaperone
MVLKDTGKIPKIYKDGQIVKLLIDTKFGNLIQHIEKLKKIYLTNGGVLDEELDVFYFKDKVSALKAISNIFSSLKKKDQGRAIIFTEAEIVYIRNALINESGFAAINNKLKDGIFKKLNG